MNTYHVLQADTEFLVAALFQTRVSVWFVLPDRERIMDYGGLLEAFSDVSIKIAGNRYFRDKFEFRVTPR